MTPRVESSEVEVESERSLLRRVIIASSLGTIFEWYDFFVYGSLAVFFGGLFFPTGNETAQLLLSLATFGAGFGVRPLGAFVFGFLGDLVGRKYTFLITMMTMGLSTALIGLLPTYESWGLLATGSLVTLRLLQGLAIGGEYGGAATYVAEHAPPDKRGYYTSFIQTTATIGFFVSIGVIGATRTLLGEEAFRAFGWRVPFLVSFLLLGTSLYMRVKLRESPVFALLKGKGKLAKNPLKESFANPLNRRYVLYALFGIAAGQGVVWYTGQFYALTFLQSTLKLDWQTTYRLMAVALALTTPCYLLFGWLSDRVGRKKIMLAGCALAALTVFPIFIGLGYFVNPARLAAAAPTSGAQLGAIALIALQMVYGCMVYGPMAAFLVELFPTRVRYTSMSVPYHFGTGWFGGFLPLIATSATTSEWARSTLGEYALFAGLLYPIAICLLTLLVGGLCLPETKDWALDR